MWRLFVLLVLSGCASAPASPFFGDERYLRFGVDPNTEASAVIESQRARAFPLSVRLLGQNFTALGFMDKGGRSAAVRILTRRGIAVALDSRAGTALQPAVSYALLQPPVEGTHDADKDGFEEVLVEQRTASSSCLYVYRVRDVGFVDPVGIDSYALGKRFCATAVTDLDGDGVVELMTQLTLDGFDLPGTQDAHAAKPRSKRAAQRARKQGWPVAPSQLILPLWAAEHRFQARAATPAARNWLAGERMQRERELADARSRMDKPQTFTLAIELAALANLAGDDASNQLSTFDRALSGLVLSPKEAAASLQARSRIYTDWNAPEAPAPEPPRPETEAVAKTESTPTPPPLRGEAEGRDLIIEPERRADARRPTAPSAPAATPPTPASHTANSRPPQVSEPTAAAPQTATQSAITLRQRGTNNESPAPQPTPQSAITLRQRGTNNESPAPEAATQSAITLRQRGASNEERAPRAAPESAIRLRQRGTSDENPTLVASLTDNAQLPKSPEQAKAVNSAPPTADDAQLQKNPEQAKADDAAAPLAAATQPRVAERAKAPATAATPTTAAQSANSAPSPTAATQPRVAERAKAPSAAASSTAAPPLRAAAQSASSAAPLAAATQPPGLAERAQAPSAAAPSTATAAPVEPAELERHRLAAREHAVASLTARQQAVDARAAAAAERAKAQAVRVLASRAADPQQASELRARVAEHVAAAQRHADEAVRLSSEVERHRVARLEHKALAWPAPAVPAIPDP